MDFAKLISDRRAELNLGVRELARHTNKPYVPFPIKSPVYISRLENKIEEEQRADAVSVDKLWAIGVALKTQPLIMFASSREMPELLDIIPSFTIRDSEPAHFSLFIKNRRLALGLTLKDVEFKATSASPWNISPAYLSQLETNDDKLSERISMEKLWTLGVIYGVDPILLYVMSRHIDPRFLSGKSRDNLFI